MCPTLCDPMDVAHAGPQPPHGQVSLSLTISWSSLKFKSIQSMMLSNRLILCCLLLLPPSILPRIRVFSNESALHIRWPKYWSFSSSISPSSEYSGLIVQATLKSLLQHHSSNASVLWHSAFFIVELSHPYMTTGKTIALTMVWHLSAIWCLCFLICCLSLS